MSKIRLLSDHLANQIAAGEVVERPASVVKELVENSLDAGASRISVQVEGNGSRLVRVVDNGEGMDEDDVLLSIERHATSKLNEDSRLDSIDTLGFRGEALPSIGSVSRLILLSRPANKDTGTRAEIRYGKLHGVHEAGCAHGTIVEVRNLFGNVPVRKKFLKTARTELFHIEEVVRNQSLAHVQTSFVLEVDGRTILDLPAKDSLQERFFEVFRCKEYWLDVEEGTVGKGMRIRGFLLHPESSSARSGQLRILVNSRPVKDRMVRHGVTEGLQGFLMKGQSPGGFLLMDIPADQVDVNVHPAKQEIRFRHSQDVHRFIVLAVKESLRKYQEKVRSDVFAPPETTQQSGIRPGNNQPASYVEQQVSVTSLFSSSIPNREINPEQITDFQTAEPTGTGAFVSDDVSQFGQVLREKVDHEKREDFVGLTLIGQLFDLYLLCEKEGQFILIDQHAAHERVLYEELRTKYQEQAIPHQSLMFPVTMELSRDLGEIMESRLDDIERLGFHVEHFGDETWIVKSVPALCSNADTSELLLDTLEGLRSVSGGEMPGQVTPSMESLLSSMACKAAVKAGNRLDPKEIIELLAHMRSTDYFSHCPHGRPVIKIFSQREIEQWFKRV